MFQDDLKVIPAEKLIDLLAELPKDTLISPNTVGNLLLLDSRLNNIGFLDIAEESLELTSP